MMAQIEGMPSGYNRALPSGGIYFQRLFEKDPREELIEDIEYLSKIAEREMEEERKAEARAKLRWEAHIAGLMQDNSVDRATALRWDMDAMDVNGDMGYYIYLWNMDYQLENELLAMLKGCE
mgnify:CR=1 FL=1